MQKETGLYVAANYDTATRKAISRYCKDNNIPNPVNEASLHTTIVYSKDPIEFEVNHTVNSVISRTGTFIDCWRTSEGQCLVLRLFSTYLHDRFNESIRAGASYDYPDYKPHITLSYDIGDWDFTQLPHIDFDLVIECEYSEPLDLEHQS